MVWEHPPVIDSPGRLPCLMLSSNLSSLKSHGFQLGLSEIRSLAHIEVEWHEARETSVENVAIKTNICLLLFQTIYIYSSNFKHIFIPHDSPHIFLKKELVCGVHGVHGVHCWQPTPHGPPMRSSASCSSWQSLMASRSPSLSLCSKACLGQLEERNQRSTNKKQTKTHIHST